MLAESGGASRTPTASFGRRMVDIWTSSSCCRWVAARCIFRRTGWAIDVARCPFFLLDVLVQRVGRARGRFVGRDGSTGALQRPLHCCAVCRSVDAVWGRAGWVGWLWEALVGWDVRLFRT